MNTTASTFFSLMAEFGTAKMLLESMGDNAIAKRLLIKNSA